MNQPKDFVLVCDIDGTLIDDENHIPQKNIDAIRRFQACGGRFMLASGRTPQAIVPLLEDIFPDMPCICMNGCTVYDFHTKQYADTYTLNGDVAAIIDTVLAISPQSGIEVITEEGNSVLRDNDLIRHHLAYEYLTPIHITPNIENIPGPWIKILFAQSPEDTICLAKEMPHHPAFENFSCCKSHANYFEVLHKQASKGAALANYCQTRNINPCNIVAVGDNENDLTMLQYAAFSYAPQNATEHVKSIINHVVSANRTGAVADVIQHMFGI